MKKSPIIKLLELGVCIIIIQVFVYLLYNLVDSMFTKHKEALTDKQKYKMEMDSVTHTLEKTQNELDNTSSQETIRLAEVANNIIG